MKLTPETLVYVPRTSQIRVVDLRTAIRESEHEFYPTEAEAWEVVARSLASDADRAKDAHKRAVEKLETARKLAEHGTMAFTKLGPQ
jgi:hypothetical protein